MRTSLGGHKQTSNDFGLVNCNASVCQTGTDTKSSKQVVDEAENDSGDVDLNKPAENADQKTCEKTYQSQDQIPKENIEQTRNTSAQKENDSLLCAELKDVFQRFGTIKVM